MNQSEIDQIVQLMEEKNRESLPTLDKLALGDELQDLDFKSTVACLVEVSKGSRWVSASDIIDTGPRWVSKYGDADAAWSSIKAQASELGGMSELAASLDPSRVRDTAAVWAFWSVKGMVRRSGEDQVLWAFREAFNSWTPDASENRVVLPTVNRPAELTQADE